MRKITALLALTILAFAQNIELTLENLSENNNIYVAIYNSKESFLNVEKAYKKLIFSPENSKSFTIENLPAGIYAIALFQDMNGDEKFDKNFLGIPQEPYGFSNNPSTRFSSPSFEDSAFDTAKTDSLTIEVK